MKRYIAASVPLLCCLYGIGNYWQCLESPCSTFSLCLHVHWCEHVYAQLAFIDSCQLSNLGIL